VSSTSDPSLGEVVLVSAGGRTLYALDPETATHLLCKTSACLRAWPPLTVPSRRTRLVGTRGVSGHLGLLRRRGGILQVTFRGMPLYRFSGDRAGGEANGQGLHSFGGTWHAVSIALAPAEPAPSSPPAAAPTPPRYPETPPMTRTPTTPAPAPAPAPESPYEKW
jgi:predicted lipoprotein with Yx(FWY)xxD motif